MAFISSSERNQKVCIVGLGYVGLPLAIEFDQEEYAVTGYDIDSKTIETLNQGCDPTGELSNAEIQSSSVEFSTEAEKIAEADYVIITVPTPIDDLNNPNLTYVESAGETVGKNLTEGTTVILESTVYPGATQEILTPAIERSSGLNVGKDFYIGYSPERMVPGDSKHGLRDVVKIVSGQNEDVLEDIAELYESIVDTGVHKAPEIKVAEAAKCIENIQRDLNIALVNELAVACNNLGLSTQDVLDAAGTKWNFHDYQPGLVGGHCIPVDPFFMIYESKRNGFTPSLIETSREVNDYMPEHVADLTIRGLNSCGKVLRDSKVLVLGVAYKPGVNDVRTSPVKKTIKTLRSYDIETVGHDTHAMNEAIESKFEIEVQKSPTFEDIDAILLTTPHEEYLNIDYDNAAEQMADNPLIIDVNGVLAEQLDDHDNLEYKRV